MTQRPQEIVPASALRPGDTITEADTPEGPWYEVLSIDPSRRSLTVDGGTGLAVSIDISSWADPVLRLTKPTDR